MCEESLHIHYVGGFIDTVLKLACFKTAYQNKLDRLAVFSNKVFVIIILIKHIVQCVYYIQSTWAPLK